MKKTKITLMRILSYSYFAKCPSMALVIAIILLCILSPDFTNAQTIKEVGTLLREMKQSGDVTVQTQGDKLDCLLNKLNPTVYISNEDIKDFGEGNPVCADVDSDAISKLYAENSLYSQVELITIRVKNLAGFSSRLDLSALANFQSLKYVRVLCEVNCTAAQVESMLTGSNANVFVCYLVSIPQ